MRFYTIHTSTPYRDTAPAGYPREVLCQIGADDRTVRVLSIEADGSEVTRFEDGPYRPSPMGRDDRGMANDILSFAQAYAERGEEFDRDPADLDQVHAEWWATHGDALTLDTSDDE